VSADPGAAQDEWDPTSTADAASGPQGPSEEELRRAYEAELSRITTTDMMAQTAISLLNLGARRLGPAPPGPPAQGADADSGQAGRDDTDAAAGRDLEQVRDAIDGVRALMGILERRIAGELGPLRDALSQLQMAYAREVQVAGAASEQGQGGGGQGGSGAPGGGPSGEGGSPGAAQPPPAGKGPGPAESSGRLWVPGR
jgi:uncharacterized membrane protein YgcG